MPLIFDQKEQEYCSTLNFWENPLHDKVIVHNKNCLAGSLNRQISVQFIFMVLMYQFLSVLNRLEVFLAIFLQAILALKPWLNGAILVIQVCQVLKQMKSTITSQKEIRHANGHPLPLYIYNYREKNPEMRPPLYNGPYVIPQWWLLIPFYLEYLASDL